MKLLVGAASCLGLGLLLSGCVAPIGAERVNTQQAYAQVDSNSLRTGKPSAATLSILHRYSLDELAAEHPDQAVRQLHEKAVETGERDLLFALAELSYTAGDRIHHSLKPWDPRNECDYYLGAAVYAWLFLYSDAKGAPPIAYDRRFREACDFYNYGLGLAFKGRRSTNATVRLEPGRRNLPVGAVNIQLGTTEATTQLPELETILLADEFRVHGLSVRNRDPGLGSPLICVWPMNQEFGLHPATPATMLVRFPFNLQELAAATNSCTLELYSSLDSTNVAIGDKQVPLEIDLTTYRAYTLSQSRIWKLGNLQFLAPSERIASRLVLNQPFDPARIPVVFVHGTFSSPVTWAEMANSLLADPEIRQRYQFWSFIYGSGNPLVQSVTELRSALTKEIAKYDPHGTNAALHEMVVIGHSQGGLLTKATAINTGDQLWKLISTNRLEDLKITEAQRKQLETSCFLTPLPFVRRVIFIATPHRGSYLSVAFVRNLAHRLVSLPGSMIERGKKLATLTSGSEVGKFLGGRMPTSLDSMSPKNPALLAMADIPVSPPIKANSIIAIQGHGDYHEGRDGLVTYQSAHVPYAESEFIVRSFHSCLDNPATIEEVRRILHKHLTALPADMPGDRPTTKPGNGE